MQTSKTIPALNAVKATTTSNKFYVGNAKKIALLFRRADHSAGSSAFTVKASLDDGNTVTPVMTALNLLIDNVTNSNAQQLTRVNGKTLSANGDALLFLDPAIHVNWLEIKVTETTDGTHSAFIIIQE